MRKTLLLAGTAGLALLAPVAAEATELALKRVMLSSGGVGYFEYEATVSGDAVLELDVRLDQVDDVMKSLVVYDGSGRVGEVSLPGRQPLVDTFRDLPFPQSALESPVALLSALRGAEVTVTGSRTLSGRILSVVPETQLGPEGRSVERTRVTLASAGGMAQFILEDAADVRFTDPALEAAVGKALAALAEHGERDRRTLSLVSRGTGERRVHVAYVVEAPLWKTSYRMTLPADPAAETAALQGWAVLENMSGEDWEQVELTLVSGNPVTFRQALYDTYYVYRPEVPVEVLGRVLPPVDEEQAKLDRQRDAAGGYAEERAAAAPGAAPGYAPAPAALASQQPSPAETIPAVAEEAATQVVFTFPEPVSVASGQSLLVPFISRDVPAERLAWYQPEVLPDHPLAAVLLENDGETGLPPGVLTLYETGADGRVGYVGDARLGTLPAGETRLVSYAVDQKIAVAERSRSEERVTGVTIARGVMTLSSEERYRIAYEISGAAREPRTVLLEQARWSGWTLVEPAEATLEATPGTWRARVPLAPGERKEVAFVLSRPLQQSLQLASLDDGSLTYYLEAQSIPAPAKAALQGLAERRAALAEQRQALARLEQELARLVTDQDRLRKNLQAVPPESDLQRRYLAELTAQEDRLATLRGEMDAARQAIAAAEAAVAEYIRGLAV